MNPAITGVFLAFSLLWTIAILFFSNVPPKSAASDSAFATVQQFGLIVNGTHYVLDAAQPGEGVHASHSATGRPVAIQRKLTRSSLENTQGTTRLSSPSSGMVPETNSPYGRSSSGQQKKSLFPVWAWYGAVLALYYARRFSIKKRRDACDEGWFARTGLDDRLVYYGDREYEHEFLSVDGSFYGAMSTWSGEELDKFDLDDI